MLTFFLMLVFFDENEVLAHPVKKCPPRDHFLVTGLHLRDRHISQVNVFSCLNISKQAFSYVCS